MAAESAATPRALTIAGSPGITTTGLHRTFDTIRNVARERPLSVSIADFWKLLVESRLLTPAQAKKLAAEFGHARHAGSGQSSQPLAEWLVSRKALSPYQARILLAGRAGPFDYGEYRVYDRIEKGRLAGQFRAVHVGSRHPVLLEFFTGDLIADPNRWTAAMHGALAACQIISPHVQRYYDLVDLPSFKFIVSEDLRGKSLEEKLVEGPVPHSEACRIVRLAAIGLAHLHHFGRVHGDVRPANVWIERSANEPRQVKLLYAAHLPPGPFDFAEQQPGSRLALAADFLAPELAHGRPPDALSDVYALGCLLYTLLAGSPPFAGGSIDQKLARHASEPIRPLETLGVPQPLAATVAYMMAKNPAVRFQSAVQAAEQLAHFVEPAALAVQPAAPPASLARFEQHLQERRASAPPPTMMLQGGAVASVTSPAAATPAPAPLFQTDAERFAAVAGSSMPAGQTVPFANAPAAPVAAATNPATPVPAIQLDVPAKKRTTLSAEEVLRRRAKAQRLKLVGGAVAFAAFIVAAIVAVKVLDPFGTRSTALVNNRNQPLEQLERPAEAETDTNLLTPTSGGRGNSSGEDDDSAPGSGTGDKRGAVGGQELIADDGQTLWASPTQGEPIDFRYVPPEGQVYLMVRPADMLAASEGAKVLAALGPQFETEREAWEAASGFQLSDIEQLLLSLHNNDGQFPRTNFVARTREAVPKEELLRRWGNPSPVEQDGATFYQGSTWSYFIPPESDEGRIFAMGDARDIREVAVTKDMPPLFPGIERLRRATDSQRHFTVLFFPQFLFNDDGAPLFAGERAKVREPLAWLLGDNLQAASASAHFGEVFYLEMRMLGTLDNEPSQLSQSLRERLQEVPRSLEDYFVALTPPPYWRKLAFRYPGMVAALHEHTRVGVEEGQAVVNAVLPDSAAHNLVLGGELLIATAPGQAPAVATPEVASGPKTIEEALALKTSYSFDNQSLEFAMRDLAADVADMTKRSSLNFEIKLIGADLEKDGITRNQSIRDFKQDNQPVADILTALVMKANPITTVKEPTDLDQKLIWVIGPHPDKQGQQAVLITTRAAAAAKGYKLPAVFVK